MKNKKTFKDLKVLLEKNESNVEEISGKKQHLDWILISRSGIDYAIQIIEETPDRYILEWDVYNPRSKNKGVAFKTNESIRLITEEEAQKYIQRLHQLRSINQGLESSSRGQRETASYGRGFGSANPDPGIPSDYSHIRTSQDDGMWQK